AGADEKAAPAAPAKAAPAKGLGIAAGAKRPGAKKAAAPAPSEGQSASATAETAGADQPDQQSKPEPEVKGLGIAPGARRPGAKKAAAPKPAAPQQQKQDDGESSTAADASVEGDGEKAAPPVKGLGIAKGARPPGKR